MIIFANEDPYLNEQELGLLLGVPREVIQDWEAAPEQQSGALRSLFVLLNARPQQCAKVLVDDRVKSLPLDSAEREAVLALSRKIHGGHV